MSDEPEPADTRDPERYDRWFEQPRGRRTVSVERDALLAAPHGCPRTHAAPCASGTPPGQLAVLARMAGSAGRLAPAIGAFQIAVLDLPESVR